MMENLVSALSKAQGKMHNANLNQINPHFRSRYADLAAIREAVIPALAAEGIALIQVIEERDRGTVVVTKLLKGEEAISSDCPIIVGDRHTPQQVGSALTYARRYAMAAIVGIAAEEDDDGNAAEDSARRAPPVQALGRQSAQLKPVPPLVAVAMTEQGEPDWETFADTLTDRIGKAESVPSLNALLKAHNSTISNLKAQKSQLYESLKHAADSRRNALDKQPDDDGAKS